MMKWLSLFFGLLFIFAGCGGLAFAKVNHHGVGNHSTININHATVKELISLKGIGPKRAKAIVAYRKGHGKFKSVDDLARVKGVSLKAVKWLLKKNGGRIQVK